MTGLHLLLILAFLALPFVVRAARAARFEQLSPAEELVPVQDGNRIGK